MAIPRSFRTPHALTVLLIAGCTVPQVAAPPPVTRPVALPAPPPKVVRPATINWRDAPLTAGDWDWQKTSEHSIAKYGGNTFHMRCDRRAGQVVLSRQGAASGEVPVTINTSSRSQTLAGLGGTDAITVGLSVGDPLLDAMAFSRGRFAVEVAGFPTLYLPSWPEVSRVVEDCR